MSSRPEIAGQSNMDAGSGVALWNQYLRPLKGKGTKLISPATTSDPAGKKWLQDFFHICGGNCDVSATCTTYMYPIYAFVSRSISLPSTGTMLAAIT